MGLTKTSGISAIADTLGNANYQDTLTAGTPIVVPNTNTDTVMTCNALGSLTDESLLPTGVSGLWNGLTSRFDFTSLTVGSSILLRIDLNVTTVTPSTVLNINFNGGIGGVPFTLALASSRYFKSVGNYNISEAIPIGILTESTRVNPASITADADGVCNVIVRGWYVEVNKR